MRVHIDNTTKQILGYYPEPTLDENGNLVEMYDNLPSPLITVTDDEYRQGLAMNANKWDGAPSVDPSLYPPAPPAEDRVNQRLMTALTGTTGAIVRALDKAFPDKDIHGLLHEALRDEVNPPPWDVHTDYTEGDIVSHGGKTYVALPDVAHAPPDDVYDADAMTGGWMPI